MRLALALALVAATAAPETAPRPNLTGRWVLDKERSEEPKPQRGRGGGMPPGHDPGDGEGQGMPGRGPGGGRPGADPRVLMEEILEPAGTLLITEDGTDLVIESGDRVLRLRPDGKVWKRENGAVETKAEWRLADLVAESRMTRGGPKLTATYSRASEARELVVTLKMDPPTGPPLTARRVYTAASD